MPMVVVVEKYNLCIVLSPKVASTTMLKFAMSLSGVDIGERNARKYARHERKFLQENGFITRSIPSHSLCEFAKQHPSYKWVAVIRNPYSRSISSYKSKVQRYARKFQLGTYVWTGLIKSLKGPKVWDDSRYHAKEVAKRIIFVDFLNGLQRHGLDWNGHFQLQTDYLAIGNMSYDLLIKQEELDEGIKRIAELVGISVASLPLLAFENTSLNRQFNKETMSVEERRLVLELYKKDFELLEYEP